MAQSYSLSDFVNREGDGGQPVVLNFWASWCGPCRIEMPHFEKVSLEYDGRAAILGINQGGVGRNHYPIRTKHACHLPAIG